MASLASERIPIATLHPSLPTPATKSITSIVTILWPYSSSTRTCALLLAEPDFRLRRRRGQVRVQFFGDAAYAVATSQLGIGDKVILKLAGAQWLQSSGEEEVVRTPGKSVEWELGFKNRLAMLVTRDGKQFANVEVEASTPEPEEEESEEEAVYNTPSKIVGRFSAEGLRFNTWSSPAFLRQGRLSGEWLSDYDPFADEDESKSRKRRRTSFKNVGVWTIAPRTPSPEKGDAMSVDEDNLASPSERPFASVLQAPALPDTPVSSRTTPAEAVVEDEEELVPEVSHENAALSRDGTSGPERISQKDPREEHEDQQDALYKQYLREASEANEGAIEEKTEADKSPDEPEDELAAQYSIQDANIIRGESESEPLPTVIPDTEEAVPSAAASVVVDDYAGDTEQDSDVQEPEIVEMSSTDADSEEEPSEYEHQDFRPQARRGRLSTTEEAPSEDGQVTETISSPLQRPEQDQPKLAGLGVPLRAPRQPRLQQEAEAIESDSEPQRRATYPRRVSQTSLSSTDEEDLNDTVLGEADREDPTGSQAAEQTPQQATEVVKTGKEFSLGAVHVAPIMPPPALPQLQTDTEATESPAKTPPIGPVNAPSTPQLQPITSNTLPLPSPFPVATEASSYMDARPSTVAAQTPVATHGDQEQHVIRPATAMSIAQSIEESPGSLRRVSDEPAIDPALQQQTPDVGNEAHAGDRSPQSQFPFGLDGAALSAIRRSRSTRAEAERVPDVVDLQDTQLQESGPILSTEVEIEKQRQDGESAVEAAMELYQRLPKAPTSAILSREEEPRTHGLLESMVQERKDVEKLKEPQAIAEEVSEQHKLRETPARSPPKARDEVVESQLLEVKRPQPDATQQTDITELQENDPFSDDYAMPIIQDDDWEMPDVEEDVGAVADFTPEAFEAGEDVEDDMTPEATPQKRTLAPAVSPEAMPPVSTAKTDIVDLGSDSEEEEDQQDIGILTTVESDPPTFSQDPGTQGQMSQESKFDLTASQMQEPALTRERLRSSPPRTPPQTRRRTRQSTIETVSQAETATQPGSQRRTRASRTSGGSQGASGVAARVAQRQRRVEVKDSECEWDSNESISTQRLSSPSVQSDGLIYGDMEPSLGLQASQILGDPSQVEPQTQEQTIERPTVSPITSVAARTTSEMPDSVDQASVEDPHDAQDRRLQQELERETTENKDDELSSSPLPDIDFRWGSRRKQKSPSEERPAQSSLLQDEFDKGAPTHSSMLQDDSSMIRAMRTSQFPFEALREEQVTPSVADEEDDSQRTVRPEPQTQVLRDRTASPTQVEVVSSPRQVEESQFVSEGQLLKDRPSSPPQVEEESQIQAIASSPEHEVAETPIPSQTAPEDRLPLQHELVEVKASSSAQTAAPPKEVAIVPQNFRESNVLTPDASQEASQLQPSIQKVRSDDILPPTPRLTQGTSVAPSFSQLSSLSAEAQTTVQPSIQEREEPSDKDTAMEDLTTDEPTPAEPTTHPEPSQQRKPRAAAIKWQPTSHALGTRTPHTYFTPLTHLALHTNSQSSTSSSIDILALCTAPSKSPLRAPNGPRDYHTSFTITDPSLPDGEGIRVQVFRPWKAALPEVEVGDAVLLRAFGVRSRKGRAGLVSGDGSAWCVFRYGRKRGASQSQRESGGVERKSIAESLKPIWADSVSGLWGAVAPSLEEVEEEKREVEGEGSAEETLERQRWENSQSGATREEVHGPPVEFGDEERREARRLREWWVGVGGKAGEDVVDGGVKEEEVQKEEGASQTKVKAKAKERRNGDGAGGGGDGRGSRDQRAERALAMDFFRSFL